MKNKIDLQAHRKEEMGKTLQEVAAALNMPFSTAQALESGAGKNFSSALKEKFARYYGLRLFDAFPEELERLAPAMSKGYYLLMVTLNRIPDLNLGGYEKYEWINALGKMTDAEIDADILVSGNDAAHVREAMTGYIAKYGKPKKNK